MTGERFAGGSTLRIEEMNVVTGTTVQPPVLVTTGLFSSEVLFSPMVKIDAQITDN